MNNPSEISLKYKNTILQRFIPNGHKRVMVIESPNIEAEFSSLEHELLEKLENPINSDPLKEVVKSRYRRSSERIILLADDYTRPNTHTKLLYPLVIHYLIEICGVKKEDLQILISTGTHRPPSRNEIRENIFGPALFDRLKDHIYYHNDSIKLAQLGQTKQGTPITINQYALHGCMIIPITDSEYHYFAGIAGTIKQVFPGIAGRITTNINHARMFDVDHGFKPACRLGNTENNPVILDLIDMVRTLQKYVPIFCIDTILDHGKITYINAGDILSLHGMAKEKLKVRKNVPIKKLGDLVIVPLLELGLNLYQAGKGIHAAWNAVRKPGGTILILAPCQDGVGSKRYRETMASVKDMPVDKAIRWVIDNKCNVDSFHIGDQKPVDLLRILKSLGNGSIKILSEMDPYTLRNVFRLDPLPQPRGPQNAITSFLKSFLRKNPNALIYVLKDPDLNVVPET